MKTTKEPDEQINFIIHQVVAIKADSLDEALNLTIPKNGQRISVKGDPQRPPSAPEAPTRGITTADLPSHMISGQHQAQATNKGRKKSA